MGDKSGAIKEEEIRRVLDFFTKNVYRAKDGSSFCEGIERKCQSLFARDYQFTVIHNGNGELCSHYPTKLIIQEYEISQQEGSHKELVEPLYDIAKLREFMFKSRLARCRGRFVVPVILIDGKHICRSATLAGGAEIYGRSGLNFIFSGGSSSTGDEYNEGADVANTSNNDWPLVDTVRAADINLLNMLSVTHICDLMLENKKVKFGLYVSSSEKIDKQRRYDDFCLISTPYPGCEFFKDYRDNGFNAKGITFDWNQQFVDASLSIPDSVVAGTTIDWHMYRHWDLIKITQNYLKLLLSIVVRNDASLLIHCISGWDRTPLYISLLRLSLWADGKANASLSALEILYLTLSYDWLLFGHNLSDRLSKGEDIIFFCFNFLKHITSADFSIVRPHRTERNANEPTKLSDQEPSRYFGQGTQGRNEHSLQREDVSQYSSCNIRCNSRAQSPDSVFYSNGTSGEVPVADLLELNLGEATPPSACGSWQMISKNGSFSEDTPQSSPVSQHSEKSSVSSISTDPMSDVHEGHSQRKQKLEEVSHLFRKIYSSVVKGRDYAETGAGSITTVLDSISSKIGFKNL